ncbi:MAG: TIM barrel protein [Planctomycetota bacterium]
MAAPGIPNDYTLSTSCFGSRLGSIQDQIFAAVGMGFRRLELGLAASPPSMEGLEESQRETGMQLPALVVGCRDPENGSPMACERLASLNEQEWERAINSVRRHVRLARQWGCQTVVLRGSKVDDPRVAARVAEMKAKLESEPMSMELAEEMQALSQANQRDAQKLVEQYCRALFTLIQESPDVTFAIEPGRGLDDLLGFEAVGWVLGDLGPKGLRYWHDVGHVHINQTRGLAHQGAWLDAYAASLAGIHLQDAASETLELPVGLGEVDFKLLREYVPKQAERVVEIGARHGRAEILASVQYLVDHGF